MHQPPARSTLVAVAAALVLVACGQAAPTPPRTTLEPQLTPVPVAATPDVTSARLTTKAYVDAVVAGDFTTAWNMLGPSAKEGYGTAGQFAADRRAFMNVAGNTVVIGEPTQAPDQLSIWLDETLRGELAPASAFVVQLDYPVIRDNSGWEVIVVAPDLAGDWRIWIVR